ncbi:TolB-like protein [Humitalea rosea]|uniref:TolB-like protein n=1 Tax=Humitalea rosea TaxID=990373 RepID=A0A2W7IJ39_9PROT|nr:hypothetical protein [Humitalea rosea]PZW46668.1 TolB-like protein [Humitalea rosea]
MHAVPELPVPTPAVVRAELDRLQRSRIFAGSERLLVLLRFIVGEVLEGRGATLKESVIGNAVYGREPPYDPRIDSTVRVEARRLRGKLKAHYDDEGRTDAIRIALPTGGYVPQFLAQSPEAPRPGGAALFRNGLGAALAIMPFRALSGEAGDAAFADGLTDELMFAFARAPGLRLISRSLALQYKDRAYSPARLAAELGVGAVLQGTTRHEAGLIRVMIEASDPRGFIVWSDRFDAPDRDRVRLQEKIAATAVSRARLDSLQMGAMHLSPEPG